MAGSARDVCDASGGGRRYVHSDTELLRSLERAGFISLAFDIEGLR